MKQILLSLLLWAVSMALHAQTENTSIPTECDTLFAPLEEGVSARRLLSKADSFSLTIPCVEPLALGGYGLYGLSPFDGGAYGGSWRLHQGFNARLGLSLSAAFGKHAPKGVGFGRSAAFAYLLPVTSQLAFAAGVYTSRMDWGAWRQTDAGFAGMLAYRVNDNLNLYAYGSKSFMPHREALRLRYEPFPVFMDRPRDRIGAAAEFKIGENAVIGVSVERVSY